jgi:hypothetical protein
MVNMVVSASTLHFVKGVPEIKFRSEDKFSWLQFFFGGGGRQFLQINAEIVS